MAASSSRNQHHIPIIHEVNFDHPGESVWRRTPASFEQYILLKQETYYDHRAQPHYSQVFSEGERWVEDYPADRLARVLAMNDAPTMLEVAVRYVILAGIYAVIVCRRCDSNDLAVGDWLSVTPTTRNPK